MAEIASLLNVADDILADLIGSDTFDESLLLNVLFQDRILIHEAFLFNSTLLAHHLAAAETGTSLFEQAARRGLIAPAYSKVGCTTVSDAYEYMLDRYGRTYPLMHEAMKPLRSRVEASVDRGVREGSPPFYWPTNVHLGEGYLALLRQMLQANSPPKYIEEGTDRGSHFDILWQQTERLRFDLIEEAAALTAKRGSAGIQRTEIFRLLGVEVGIPYAETSAPSTATLIERSVDEQRQLVMQVFVKWVTQVHHANQASAFGTAMNFPAYHLDQDFMLDSLLRTPLDAAPLQTEGLRCEVMLPPLAALLRADTDRLVGIRNDLGEEYLHTLRRWNKAPTSSHSGDLERALRDYCVAISQRYEKGLLEPVTAEFSTKVSPGLEIVGGAGLTFASSVVTGLIQNGLHLATDAVVARSALAAFVTMATKGAIAVVSFARRQREALANSPAQRQLDLTLPAA